MVQWHKTVQRKTRLLTLNNIRLFRHKRELDKFTDLGVLTATSITITFVRQKNGVKDAEITMHKTNQTLCPVTTCIKIVQRILGYPGTSLESLVTLVVLNDSCQQIFSKITLTHIRNTIAIIDPNHLGFDPGDAGNHSIRSLFSMFLYLSQVRSDRIMLQGRWRSQAFLTYIRPQVSVFSKGLNEKMLERGAFYTVPDNTTDQSEHHIMFDPIVNYVNQTAYNSAVETSRDILTY